MAIIRIPTTMQKYTHHAVTVEVQGETVQAALEQLVTIHPELKQIIFSDNNQLKGYLNIFINEKNIREAEYLKTKISDDLELLLLPAVVGG
ncbi:MoaD/ThiS family protein [Photobacterium galatheae]|uniref:Thiamine biosynthesis protein ThiS n=1 Tax=Photobacterium galatheae TaxID=1654360 RepID=A0A066RI38_9GAMM|nr:MoaD/ThiS family protein [Photobacterium galatheae]KDM89989.1 hypothetical protein EA58_18765 [Photobacterium galatheae]MCM0149966.1 MoaD/ThiS family protein [Photobacterium galatheae]